MTWLVDLADPQVIAHRAQLASHWLGPALTAVARHAHALHLSYAHDRADRVLDRLSGAALRDLAPPFRREETINAVASADPTIPHQDQIRPRCDDCALLATD